ATSLALATFPYATLFRSRGGGCRRPGEGARRSPFRWPREGSRRSGPDALAAPGALLEHHAEGHLGEPQVLADAVAQVVLVRPGRSEEHTSELQSREKLVC